jgi:hypothetical protein
MKDFILNLIKMLIPMILSVLKDTLSNEKFVEFADSIFDWVERKIQEEPDEYDAYLLDLIVIVRMAIGVPDLPDE